MSDFLGIGQIVLRPGTSDSPHAWVFPACSTETSNDGAIPHGTTIASATVTIYNEAGVDVTTTVLDTGSVAVSLGTRVSARLNHPGGTATLRCTAVIACTLSTGAVITFDCRRILVDGVTG